MNADNLPALLTAGGVVLTAIGAGIRWVVNYVERQVREAAGKETQARDMLSARLNREIDDLGKRITELSAMLRESASRENTYIRRIMTLESYIGQQPGLKIPESHGWPP